MIGEPWEPAVPDELYPDWGTTDDEEEEENDGGEEEDASERHG